MSLRSELMELIKRIALGHRDHEHRLRELEMRTAGLRYYQVGTNNNGAQGIDNNPLIDHDVYRYDLTKAMSVRYFWASGNANGHQVGVRSSILLKTTTTWYAMDGTTVVRVLDTVPVTDQNTYSAEANRVTANLVTDTAGTGLSI